MPKANQHQVHAALEDLAMVTATSSANAAAISVSAFYEAVRQGIAPQPVIRKPRMTRWALKDIRVWLQERASQGFNQDTVAIATKASAAAKAKRTAGAAAAAK